MLIRKLRKIFREGYRFLQNKCYLQKQDYNVMFIIENQYDANGFNRFDIIIRLLAIECYYGENAFGISLYEKLSKHLGGRSVQQRWKAFQALIESYERNGYDNNSYVLIDDNMDLIDGSHRIALALYHSIGTIPCKVVYNRYHIQFGIERLHACEYSVKEINQIVDRFYVLRQIKKDLND